MATRKNPFADPEKRAKMIMSQFQYAVKEPVANIKYSISEKDINVWHILFYNITGTDDEFVGGEYLMELYLGPETGFPYKPPHFKFLTENGVYGMKKDICVSIGKYHSDSFRPALKASGFVIEMLNGLICHKELGGGIGLSSTSWKRKRALAGKSRLFNWQNYAQIMKAIGESFDGYSAKWDLSKLPGVMLSQLQLERPTEEEVAAAESADNSEVDTAIGKLAID